MLDPRVMAQAASRLGKTIDRAAPDWPGTARSIRVRPGNRLMEPLLVSTGIVALAEIGDKTQLLALVLAARFRKPLPIIAGITLATLLNHGAAGALGAWITSMLGADTMRIVLGLSFLAMALWVLIPDKVDESAPTRDRFGAFATTLVLFFLVEIGDKTQVATVMLAAQYHGAVAIVIMGTTLGMLAANVPVVLLGGRFAARMPKRAIHVAAAGVFLVFGIAALLS